MLVPDQHPTGYVQLHTEWCACLFSKTKLAPDQKDFLKTELAVHFGTDSDLGRSNRLWERGGGAGSLAGSGRPPESTVAAWCISATVFSLNTRDPSDVC